MSGFVQIIEFTTSRIEEIQRVNDEWRASHEAMGPERVTVTADRDRPGTYCSIVEFRDYDEAMRNSDDPETSEFARRMAELCDAPPVFRNLDVLRQEVRMPGQQRAGTSSLTDA